MKVNKIGSIFLISVLALAGIGISYAGWFDQITVTGTVNTGNVGFNVNEYSGTWVWKQISTHGKIEHNGPVAATDLNGNGIKDDDPVAFAAGWYSNSDYTLVAYSYAYEKADGNVGFQYANLYPCVDFNTDFKFTIGTIPVFLTATDLTWAVEKVNGVNQFWIHGINPPTHPTPTVQVTIKDQNGNTIYAPGTQPPIQLHPGVTYTWNLLVHIPQDNVYMNCYAEGSCTLTIVQWSDPCGGYGHIPSKDSTLKLPAGIVNAIFTNWGPNSYWDTYLTGLTGGPYSLPLDSLANVHCVGWCVDEDTYIVPGQTYTIRLMSSYNTSNPWADPDWPKVNYIINHKQGTKQDVQSAIWYFLNHGYSGSDPDVLAMIADANANGATFVPQAGQMVAVLCIPDLEYQHSYHVQHTFIEVDP